MRSRANSAVYWPGMSSSITNFRLTCSSCETNAPLLPPEPLILSKSPEWPFQQLCMDYFFIDLHAYLVVVDRYSGWPCIFHFKPGSATSANLLRVCRDIFITYGVPENIGSDGGPQLTSHDFKNFLLAWGIDHRLSSVAYAQSNGRAEAGVKTAKHIIYVTTYQVMNP